MLIFKFHPSQLLTNFGLIVACLGIVAAMWSQVSIAVICLLICGLADLYDGPLARLSQRSLAIAKQGVELDSLTDAIAFAILPLVIFQALNLRDGWHTSLQCFLVWASVTRLSVFNITALERQADPSTLTFYQGLPVTSMALFVPLIYFGSLFFEEKIFSTGVRITILIVALMQIGKFKVPKPHSIAAYLVLTLIPLVLIGVVTWINL